MLELRALGERAALVELASFVCATGIVAKPPCFCTEDRHEPQPRFCSLKVDGEFALFGS